VAALGLALALIAVFAFFVGTHLGQSIDENAFAGAAAWRGPLADAAAWMLDALPAIAVASGAVLMLGIAVVRRVGHQLLAAVAAAAAAMVSTQLLKYLLVRPNTGIADWLSNSLPSGHTTAAASAALAVFLVSSPRTRPTVAVLGSVFTVVAGSATLINQWHRPSDVIAAILVVCFWGCAAGFVLAGMPAARARGQRVVARLTPLALIAAVFAVIAVVGLVVTATAADAESHLFVAYVGSISAIAAVGLGCAWIGNRMFAWLR